MLGIDLAGIPKETTMGVGGGAEVWYCDVYLKVLGSRFPARVGFIDSPLTQFGLLGRADFFQAFHVGFDQARSQVHLQPAPP